MNFKRSLCWALAVFCVLQAPGLWGASEADDEVMVSNYRKAIEVNAQDVLANFNLGLALYKLDRFEEARGALTRCLEVNRAEKTLHLQVDGPAYQLLGIMALNHFRDYRGAVEFFLKSQKTMPQDADTHYALSMAYANLQEYEPALKSLERAAESGHARDAEYFFQRAALLAALEREPEAVSAYEEALKLKPDFSQALENLALIYHRQGKDDSTIEVLNRLIKLEPNNFNANYMLGLHYFRKQMYADMVAAYNRAVAVKPDMAEAHYNLGMAYYYQTRYEQAVDELKKAVTLNPKDAEAYNLLGQAQTAAVENYLHQGGTYLAQENYREAAAALQKVFVIDPNNARARDMLEEAQRRTREEFAAHMRLGEKFFQENKLEEAYNEFELASRLNPAAPEVREGMRKAGAQMGRLLSQRMQKAKAAENQSDFREAFLQYASALELKNDYAPAKQGIKSLHKQLKQDIQNQFKLAEQALEQKQLNEAVAAYKKILKMAELTRDEAEQSRALAAMTRVNLLRAETVSQTLMAAKKEYAAGNESKAHELFNLVLKWEPQNKTANEFIVKITGATSQAKVTDEQIKTTYYRGVDFYVNGKIEEAIAEWEKVVALDPENQDARINIARAKAKLDAIRKLTVGN